MLKMARDLVSKISLFCSLESALIDKLEELDKTQYRILEENKRIIAVNRDLERRYSELFYAFSSLKKDLPSEMRSLYDDLLRRVCALEVDSDG